MPHPSLTALRRYIVSDEAGGIRDIDLCPVSREGEIGMTVHSACIALTGACVAFNQIVGFTVAGRELGVLADLALRKRLLALDECGVDSQRKKRGTFKI
jgi:hypothetical protein